MSAEKLPEIKTIKLIVDPYQGAAMPSASICPPEGYVFESMNRKGKNVMIRYRRKK